MIDILLATYNGAAWLDEQLDSLLDQDFDDWRLLARDDGSSDGTPALLEARLAGLGDRAGLLADSGTNLGPGGNFARLMAASDADYLMFCDQDDVWLPGKISLTLQKMQALEAVCGTGTPLLVHTDLSIADRTMTPLAESGHRYQRIDPERGAVLGRLLVQNVATGCTIMINRALRDLALPLPAAALMHDHWLSLVAACFGRIGYLPQPTMSYRQHGGNQVGAQRWSPDYALRLLWQLPAIRKVMMRNRRQAAAFYQRYQTVLQDRQRATLQAFITMPEHGLFQRRRDIFRYGFFYAGAVRNLGWLLLC